MKDTKISMKNNGRSWEDTGRSRGNRGKLEEET
jgi:hypothetical protein